MIKATLKSKIDEDICVMLNFEQHPWNYLCDCGYASQLSVKDCINTAAIFVSHTHIDHFINFDEIMRHQLGTGNRVVVCGYKGLSKNVQAKMMAFGPWNLLDKDSAENVSYEVREVDENQTITVYLLKAPLWKRKKIKTYTSAVVFENEAFSVKYTLLDHGVSCVAYLFEETAKIKVNLSGSDLKPGKWIQELKNAYAEELSDTEIDVNGVLQKAGTLFQYLQKEAGYKFGYIIDHHADENNHLKIRELFQGCDEVYIESYYSEDEKEYALKNRHSTARQSGKVAREAGIKKAVPVHFSRRYHKEDGEKVILEEFFEEFNKKSIVE
jgi:ribonuclease Z